MEGAGAKVATGAVTGGGVRRGGTERGGALRGTGGCAGLLVLFWVAFSVGNGGRGGTLGTRTGGVSVGFGTGVNAGDVTGLIVAAGVVSGNGGTLRWTGEGVGIVRGGIEGEGFIFIGGVIEAAGAGDAAMLGEATVLGGAVATTVGEGAIDGLGRTVGVADGRARGDEEAAGVALAAATDAFGLGLAAVAFGKGVAVVTGVGLVFAGDDVGLVFAGDDVGLVFAGDIVGLAFAGDSVGLAFATGGVGLAVAGVGLAAVTGVGEAFVVVSTGFTNFFGGALGGGVASVLILVRARSAAERSLMSVHPLSTFTSVTRSLIRVGR